MKAVIILGCVLLFASAIESQSFGGNIGAQCQTQLNAYTVNTFSVNPWPPTKNSNVAMSMTGVMNQAETLKAMGIFVFFNGQSFYQESIPESGTYAAGQACNISFKVYFPPIIPSGNYAVDVELQNTQGQYLNCWEVKFSI